MAGVLALASPLRWWRFARLEAGQRQLLVEAAARLAVAALRVRLLSFERSIRSGALPLKPFRTCDSKAIARAVRCAATVAPFRAVCLQEGLACQAMLRARGLDARLRYGAAVGEMLEAHVWVTVEEQIVIGQEEAARFQPVACFPA